jgi:hypothetical protein
MKLHWLLLPLLSVAVLLTVVTPSGKVDPLAGTLTRLVTVPHKSDAVTMKLIGSEVSPGGAVALRFSGQIIVGG